ncbi:FkbM family methyltransferase [Pleurocapsa sp. FMAR1]|uniref:FkbM family methyltransferase n=1 Tax=Pleurocapsa sp. FMAR1 TaxID=3040204 RepID=UPI0029C92508|nr:FkbM family methyltransferase [Pleurocapsa sp. FMAR1]
MMHKLRNSIAYLSRSTPYFRGKRRLGNTLSRFLTNLNNDQQCITKVRMQDGTSMQLDVRSRTEQWSYWTGLYDNDIISRLSSCLKEKCVVFDVGANIGFYSVPLGRKLQTLNGKLYAFEPVKSNFDCLETNILLNNLEKTVIAHDIALGDDEGIIEISMENENNSSTGNAVISKGEIPTSYFGITSKAHLTRLDTFVKKANIKNCHLIKIDVEGAEVMFLRGGASFLSQTRPIIYGEFNNYFLPKFGASFMDVVDIVSSWNYRFFQQKKSGHFIEIKQFKPDLEHIILAPSETPNSILNKLGVI